MIRTVMETIMTDETIKSQWIGWDNQNKCPLCGREGDLDLNVVVIL